MAKRRTLTERENALRVMTRSGDPEWFPVDWDFLAPISPSPMRERPEPGKAQDWFGVEWVWDDAVNGFAPDLTKPFLLDDVTRWREVVRFPDLDAIDWEAAAAKDLADVDRENRVVRLMIDSGPFERTHHLLGMTETFIAMQEEPEAYKELIEAIADYKIALIDKLVPAYRPDELFLHDDMGMSSGAMFSLETYRELIKPAHMRIGQAVDKYDVIHTHHSCGCMQQFVEDLRDTKATLFQPIQSVNDRVMLAERFGGKVSFDVVVDSLNYESTTEEQLRSEVRDIIDTFGPYKCATMFILPLNTAWGFRNLEIALDEARTYGGSFYE